LVYYEQPFLSGVCRISTSSSDHIILSNYQIKFALFFG